ncbi:MAG: hypothetical protein ACKO32_02655 [Planctomycetia bacterium]
MSSAFDPAVSLVSRHLEVCVVELQADPGNTAVWERADALLGAARQSDPDLAAAVDARDMAGLRSIVEAWFSGKRPLPAQDQEVLRRALKAFQKALQATILDAESGIGGRGMSSGRHSGIVGIQAPTRFTPEVWNQLVRQGVLRGGRHGIFELVKP